MTEYDPVTEADLQAYVDGQLGKERRLEVESYLDSHPEQRERIEAYRSLNQALCQRYDGVTKEPVPERLLQVLPRRRKSLWRQYAAAALWLITGGVTGAVMQSMLPVAATSAIQADLVKPASFAHVVYSPEALHPVDVAADREEDLVKWLSMRLHTDIRAPNLTELGYHLIGGRLLPSTNRMAAQFMYEDREKKRITLYVRTGAWGNGETAFRYAEENGVGVFYWIDGAKGYAVSGEVSKRQLLGIATAAYNELGGSLLP